MEKSKLNFIINSSITSLLLIIISIQIFFFTRGEAVAYLIILPVFILFVSYLILIFSENDFAKRSYKISFIFSYISILFIILTSIFAYQISNYKDPSPGAGAILFLVPFVGIAGISLLISIIEIFMGMSKRSMVSTSNMSSMRKLIIVLNAVIFAPIIFMINYGSYILNTSGRYYPSSSFGKQLIFLVAIISFISLILSFVFARKNKIFWIAQLIMLICLIYSVYKIYFYPYLNFPPSQVQQMIN